MYFRDVRKKDLKIGKVQCAYLFKKADDIAENGNLFNVLKVRLPIQRPQSLKNTFLETKFPNPLMHMYSSYVHSLCNENNYLLRAYL